MPAPDLYFLIAAVTAVVLSTLLTVFGVRASIAAKQLRVRLDETGLDLAAAQSENARLQIDLAETTVKFTNAEKSLARSEEERRLQTGIIEKTRSERDDLDRRLVKNNADAEALEKRLKDLRDAKEQMRQEFNEVAGQLLKSHGAAFKEQNKEQIDHLLSPLQTKIVEFEKGVSESHKEGVRQHAALKEQISLLSDQSAKMSKETQNLTRALKGKVQMQGAWGEMILETILQRSGLREGEEYTKQDTHSHDDGRRVRTDFIVHLPNGERLIIDSKVSLSDFENFVNADNEDERASALASHALSVKSHIKNLAGKEYHAAAGSALDFVIMFVPIEAALGAAAQHDGEIGLFAADKQVAITTPTTLTIALKTVASIWRNERQNQNAVEIASRAGKLYEKFVGFVDDLKDIGMRTDQLQQSYDKALGKLATGRGNLVSQVEKLKELGAATNKSIDAKLLDNDEPPLIERKAS